jgi:diguanylate cyclase (GGDEF)-like protein/PAS domain S-box-containing protein
MKTTMATFNQLQQLLEQSLRNFQAEKYDCSEVQEDEQELDQALHHLTHRLSGILRTTSEPSSTSEPLSAEEQAVSPPAHVSFSANPQIYFVTSGEGVIRMASDAACEMLGMESARIGSTSIAEFVPQEEWRSIRNHLHAALVRRGSLQKSITILPARGVSRKVSCIMTPLFDHSQNVAAWHWEMIPEAKQASTQLFKQLVQTLEAQLFAGQSVEVCLGQICKGLVHTLEFPFVWVSTTYPGHGIRLRCHAVAEWLDWNAYGHDWWTEISKHEQLGTFSEGSEVSLFCGGNPQSGEIAWFPPCFQLHDALCISLGRQEGGSSMLVVCSARPQAFDEKVIAWLQALGKEIDQLMARGRQLEQWRLHSAVIGSVNDAVCVTDPQGRLEWVNEAYAAMLGVSIQQLLGLPLRSFPSSELQALNCPFDSSAKDLGCVKTEVMQTGKDGTSLVLEQVITPLVNEHGQLTHFVAILHDVTARRTQELLMKHQASHDPLTDLPNRIMFEDRLQQALAHARRNGTLVALFFLDLDNFKMINDQHGHQTGDRVLRIVAKRLVTCVRSTDTVARLCGDEFTIILQGLDRIQDIRQVAQKILECLSPPVRLGGQEIPIQISIGIAVYPKDSSDPHRLLKIADQAMYQAKNSGGQGWFFATSEWNAV